MVLKIDVPSEGVPWLRSTETCCLPRRSADRLYDHLMDSTDYCESCDSLIFNVCMSQCTLPKPYPRVSAAGSRRYLSKHLLHDVCMAQELRRSINLIWHVFKVKPIAIVMTRTVQLDCLENLPLAAASLHNYHPALYLLA